MTFCTYYTKYGKITLYSNEQYIGNEFRRGRYWDEDTLLKLREYINPGRNILEIGGHCGTSSIVYASFLDMGKKAYVYEPQRNMYNLLVRNIKQNNLDGKIIPFNSGVFCYSGVGKMTDFDCDGNQGQVSRRYTEETGLPCNFGGISLGSDGEQVNLVTVDGMELDDIGFIHCDAQGSESFIFSKATATLRKYRPVIFYENNLVCAKYLHDNVCAAYPEFHKESLFDVKRFCLEELNYSHFIDRFNGSSDTLLIP